MKTKGNLLFDSTQTKHAKAFKKSIMRNQIEMILVLFGVSTVAGATAFYNYQALPAFLVLGIPSILFGIYIVNNMIKHSKILGDLKVYENGIVFPWRTLKQAKEKKENFLFFDDIDEIYLNVKKNLEYITVRTLTRGNLDIDKNFVPDIIEFANVLEKKVKVYDLKDFPLSKQERWHVRCMAEK
jgi:hypothetical protein